MSVTGTSSTLYAGIEGGGTKFVCAVAKSPREILDRMTIATEEPHRTLTECVKFFVAAERKHGPISAFGIACFGPLQLKSDASDFGHLLQTPKAGWSELDLLAPFRNTFDVPIALDSDVGASALAELDFGAGRGVRSLVYFTIGTGIGGAVAPADSIQHRLMHAEMGHLLVRRDPRDSDFEGLCPFHRDCVEGLASGPAIVARWGCRLDELPADHPGWSIIGGYIGQLAASVVLIVPVERVVVGGGVMSGGTLLPIVRTSALEYLNGYLAPLRDTSVAANFICSPALGTDAGIVGALSLAMNA